ncbi:hypothetical protein IF1G_04910 [Cordyceps javanica]|uniref:Uncharacterized protein n=1 Tax=Cordyceps javanica TaxID=43265 RepID=A0A545V3N4_9HYPO|nr:hypothetical protein IF1G_04910 [Cordyceps javanica]
MRRSQVQSLCGPAFSFFGPGSGVVTATGATGSFLCEIEIQGSLAGSIKGPPDI